MLIVLFICRLAYQG